WRLFGHILRRDPCIPVNEAMQFYFVENNKRPRGRPIAKLPVTLNNDPKHVPGANDFNITERPGFNSRHYREPRRMEDLHRRDKKRSSRSCAVRRPY
ncbi:hypothetical protein ElyMa_001083300, partial [Elysia marginata]